MKKLLQKLRVFLLLISLGEEEVIEAQANMNSMALKEKDPEIILYNGTNDEDNEIIAQYKAEALLSGILYVYP